MKNLKISVIAILLLAVSFTNAQKKEKNEPRRYENGS